MKRAVYKKFLLLIFIPLFFSCEQRKEPVANNTTARESVKTVEAVDHSPEPGSRSHEAPAWTINPNASTVAFTIKNAGLSVDGTFGELKGNIFFDDKNPESSSFEGSVEVNTIKTGISMRDRDLQKEKFFDEEKYKQITFRSTSISRTEKGYKANGTLTIKGKSKEIEMPFTFQVNGSNGLFKSSFTLNRRDFDVGGNELTMGNEVNVALTISARKK